jgi:hypothetical protein
MRQAKAGLEFYARDGDLNPADAKWNYRETT